MSRPLRSLIILLVGTAIAGLIGCARGGEDATGPEAVMDLYAAFAGPVDESSYYYVAFSKNGGYTQRFPIPATAGPFWGNGWGTGSISHFLSYQLGRYDLYTPVLAPNLIQTGGGVTAVSGTPTGTDAGLYTLRTGDVTLGAVTVTGAGTVHSVANASCQVAGDIALQTDAAGLTVAGSVTFTPAATGGRALTAAEAAQIAALNTGGVTLAPDSLSAFGLTLTLGAPVAGSQTLTVAPATAPVTGTFVPNSPAAAQDVTGTLTANSINTSAIGPIPGAQVTTGDLAAGGSWRVDVEFTTAPLRIGSPYTYTLPAGGNALRATLDLADFGTDLETLAFNIIATTELIADPSVTDPAEHCYDGLGPLGNDAVSINADEFQTYSNATTFVRELEGDTTLKGQVTAQRRASVDITDWTVTLRRIR